MFELQFQEPLLKKHPVYIKIFLVSIRYPNNHLVFGHIKITFKLHLQDIHKVYRKLPCSLYRSITSVRFFNNILSFIVQYVDQYKASRHVLRNIRSWTPVSSNLPSNLLLREKRNDFIGKEKQQ